MSHPQRSGECQNSTPAILSSARSLFSSCAMIPSLLFWPPSLSTRAPRSVASSRNGGCQPESDPTQAGIEGDRGRSRARRKHATPLLRASSGSGKQAALLKREANEPSASLSQSIQQQYYVIQCRPPGTPHRKPAEGRASPGSVTQSVTWSAQNPGSASAEGGRDYVSWLGYWCCLGYLCCPRALGPTSVPAIFCASTKM